MRLQSKFKAQLIAVYFNCSGDIIITYVGVTTQFSVEEWTLQKMFVISLDYADIKNNEKMSKERHTGCIKP